MYTFQEAAARSMGTPMADALNSAVAVHSLLGLIVLAQVRPNRSLQVQSIKAMQVKLLG